MKRVLVSLCLLGLLNLFSLTVSAQPRGLPDFSELVEKYGSAVVNISSTQTARQNRLMPQLPFDEDDPMFDFFRRFVPRHPGGPLPPREYENKSLGSGFIISPDGYLLTNAHVVDGADEITVRLTDKREFRARIIGADTRSDVALLKIDAAGLPVARLGDPNSLRVGEWVVAIGSPFGFDNSVTAGIVSAKGRSLPQENYVPFIQTDVAINPGNSGGPLFNMKGEVVGMNSQIYSRSGGYQGIAFAIPIDVAMEIQGQLRANGRVNRGRIGVVIQEVTRDLADSFGLPKATGAIVSSVESGSPAEKAGIQTGDVILKFDGKTVGTSSDLPRLVGTTRPGTRVALQVWRKGSNREVGITVGEMPVDERAQGGGAKKAKPVEKTANRLGLVVSEIPEAQKKALRISGGLLIEDIKGGTARPDLRPGDVILAVINKGITTDVVSIDQFNKMLAQFSKDASITLLIRRGDMQTFITIKGLNGN